MATRLSILCLTLFSAHAAFAGTWVDRYWPVNDGDHRIFSYGQGKQLTIDTSVYGGDFDPWDYESLLTSYSMAADSPDGSGTEYHLKVPDGIVLESVKVGWVRVSLSPKVLILDDALLQSGGKRVTRTEARQQGIDYPATFTVAVSKAGKVAVPAGTFPDCRNIVVTEVATVPGQGTIKATAMTAVLAPNVGIIKKLVKPGVWAVLTGGTIDGADISTLVPPTHDVLDLAIEGEGMVTPSLSGEGLELGRTYKLTAKAAPGWIFIGWSGSYESQANELSFTMRQGLQLTAHFMVNPFYPGAYTGLFSPPTGVELDKAGRASVTITEKGRFSGKLIISDRSYPFSGSFNWDGVASLLCKRKGQPALQMSLAVSGNGLSGTVSGTNWSAEIECCKSAYSSIRKCLCQGKYSFFIHPNYRGAGIPGGVGYGTLTIDSKGIARLAGVLPDATVLTQSAALAADDTWPIYVTLYSGRGCLIGWNRFNSDQNGAGGFGAELKWLKLPTPKSALYKEGFALEAYLYGVVYVPPPAGAPIFTWSNGEVMFTDVALEELFTNQIQVTAKNKIVNLSTNKLSLTLTTSSGLFKGSVVIPGTKKSVRFGGAISQELGLGYGCYTTAAGAGSVALRTTEASP